MTSQWFHGVSNHRQPDCAFNILSRLTARDKTISPFHWPFMRESINHRRIIQTDDQQKAETFPCDDVIRYIIDNANHCNNRLYTYHHISNINTPDSNVHEANTGAIWGRQTLPAADWVSVKGYFAVSVPLNKFPPRLRVTHVKGLFLWS